ncbi:FGGY family carbohydrate kinase [Pricia sp. S334]|uniref:FGGY family carbohydrate kinase n=1 Tax=Pricia mediterranea TaxID=3076079 RepID=A0ABU3L6L1_9FLAO|nr:FGGY family carbohydrate kinase [Pricia sp. S334]MDT7829203.1 FGGY family carbohydrate kinase [Pricia sp. S334]
MYSIGYDIGSSSIKAALVETATGKKVAVVSEPKVEMEMNALKNGWAEQNPDMWWEHVCNATRSLIKKSDIKAAAITGIGISYQMHGLVVVDKEGKPLRDSIIWCDSRAVEIGQKAFDELGNDKCAEHLLNSPANFTASKLKWVRENEPDIYSRIHKFMLPGDYIAYKLSGLINTTLSGLSEGVYWDFKSDSIADWLLDYYGIEQHLIADIVDTFSIQSRVSKRGAEESGLVESTPIYYRAGDQPNNALSLNVFNPGEVAATGGTSGVIYAITDSLSIKESSRVNNFAHVNYTVDSTRIGKMACINGAGIMYRWLMKNLAVSDYEEMNNLAATVPIGSDGVTIHPFGNGAERVLNNRDLGTRLAHINLNNHQKAHLCRAALEGVAFAFVYGMEILKSDGIAPRVIRTGNDNLFRAEIFSNTVSTLIGHEIEVYDTTGAIGAARACELHEGDFENFGQRIMENDYVTGFKPAPETEKYARAYEKWKTELEYMLEKN